MIGRRTWWLLGAVWTVPGLLQFLQEATYARANQLEGYDPIHAALLYVPVWLPWVPLSLIVAAATRRLARSNGKLAPVVAAHVLLAIVSALAHLVYIAWVQSTFPPPHFPIPAFAPWLRQTLWSANVQGEFLAYAGVVVATLGWDAHVKRVQDEQESVRRALTLEAQLTQARLDALSAQIRPHFLFNALNSVQALMVDEPARADEMITRIAELLRSSMGAQREQLVPLSEELGLLDPYVAIERIRFGDRVSFRIVADPSTLGFAIPPWTLQPLVENALRHGVGREEDGGMIEVVTQQSADGELTIDVRDDGAGPGAQWREGVGLSNVKARLKEAFGDRAGLALLPVDGGGACARVTVPAEALDVGGR